jgi:hypothetical protein
MLEEDDDEDAFSTTVIEAHKSKSSTSRDRRIKRLDNCTEKNIIYSFRVDFKGSPA